jgi:hypothetical protein
MRSDERGRYFFTFIPPGSYRLTVELQGFQTHVQTGMTLQVQQAASVDVVLRPGDIATTVEVTGEAPRLDSVNATVGRVIEHATMDAMPVGDWNVLSLVTLTAGVNENPPPAAAATARTSTPTGRATPRPTSW